MTEQTVAAEPRDCPYVGLDYYRENVGTWFFGREADGDKIITNLLATRLTLLHAESGVGKSSLLRAGVAWRLNRLARTEQPAGNVADLPVVFSSWKDDPVKELIGQIRAATKPFLNGRPVPELPRELDAAIEVAAYAADVNLLVILDQFEEYFLYCARESTPEHFADELAHCVNRADVPANFLIAIREDAYAGLGELFKGRIANVYGNYLHIEYLDRNSAEQAIRAPLEVYNKQPWVTEHVTIQDGLVDAVIDQVRTYDAAGDPAQGHAAGNGTDERFATPLLQLAMETIWKREAGQHSHELRLSTLETLEGVGKIVDTHVSQALGTLGDRDRQTAIDLFEHLVTPSGGKIAESVPDLARRTGHREDQVHNVLDRLDDERIVRPVPAPPGQDPMRFRRYEIFHDVLAPTINHAINAREGRRRAQRLRRASALAVGLLIVSVVLASVFFALWRKSVNERQTALSDQMAAVASSTLTVDPDMSALLARRALSLSDTRQAEEALRAALPDIQAIRTFPGATAIGGAAFDPANANEVAGAGPGGKTWIMNVQTGHRLVPLSPPGGTASDGIAVAVAFNQAGTRVAVGYQYGDVAVFSTKGTPLQVINVGSLVNNVQFAGSTDDLAIATYKNAVLLTPQDGSLAEHTLYGEPANVIAADPADSHKFAVATDSGTRILNLNSDLQVVNSGGQALPAPPDVGSNYVTFSSDGNEVATAESDGTVRVYKTGNVNQVAATLDADHGVAQSVAIGSSDKLIVAGYSSGATIVWDALTDTQLTQLTGNEGSVDQVQFGADGHEVVTASLDGAIRVWHAQPRELAGAFPISVDDQSGKPKPAYSAEYSPDGSHILAVDGSGFANVLTTNGTPVASVGPPAPTVYVDTAVYNQAGTEIVTADSDGTVDTWSASGSYPQITSTSPIKVNGGQAEYAAFSPDGNSIVATTENSTAEVFNARTGQRLHVLSPTTPFLLPMAVFSPDGRQIITVDGDGQAEVWDAATGHEIRLLGTKGPGTGIDDIQFDATGKYFATISIRGSVTIWSAEYQRLDSFDACASPYSVSLSPGGKNVVVACGDGSVPVYTRTGQEMTVESDPGVVYSAAFSPDGRTIVTAFGVGQTGGVRIWSSELANPSRRTLDQLAKQRIIGHVSAAQVSAALAGTSGWPSTP